MRAYPIWFFCLSLAMTLMKASAASERVDFNFHVRPLLSDRCYACHGPDPKGRKAKLRLDTEEGLKGKTKDGLAIITPGKRQQSDLWRRIVSKDPDEVMPPASNHTPLTPEEIETLGQWIDEGAEYKTHWAFSPVARVNIPTLQDSSWGKNIIDRFVLSRLVSLGMKPSPEAPKEQWLRRVSIDLTGLPPTLAEIDAFLADTSSQAYEHVVDRVLASPAYGETMASLWLDLARYADTYGYQADVDRDMSPWRDWVIRAFNENLPMDQFFLWQLAGDLLPNATSDQVLATAFNRLHRQTNEGGSIEQEFRTEYVADRVHTAGTAFLGLTLECSRCHDHKYDPISQRDYYRLFAMFNNIDESGLYSHFTRAVPTPTLLLYGEGQEAKHRALTEKVHQAEAWFHKEQTSIEKRFQEWQNANPKDVLPQPSPVASFHFDRLEKDRFYSAETTNIWAGLSDAPELVSDNQGKHLKFNGDNSVVCHGVGHFNRTQPFTLRLRIRPTENQVRAVVLHHSRAWTDSGSRGYELVLENGYPSFSLIHFWPGNAIAIRAQEALALNTWSDITITYDGSSRASGIRLYRDGKPMATTVVHNHLYKDILHRGEWGDADVGGIDLTLGARFRDSGFKNGEVDDLEVFETALTADEVLRRSRSRIESGESIPASLEAFLARQDTVAVEHWNELKQSRQEENAFVNDIREIMVMRELDVRRPAYVLRRGAYDAPTDPVEPGVPERIFPMPAEYPKNRLGLARWVVDRRNPLTSRVAVNHIWKHHFGRGLVATVQDFGAQGQLPSHPDLMDWLAGYFMESGWDRKQLHRLIVLSATYRQSSDASPALLAKDPENRFLAHGPRHRWSAEQIRDAALAVSGLLVPKVGGPSVKPYQPAGVWEDSGTGKTYVQDKGEALYRRSLYTFWRRTAPPPSMLSFDATSREVCTAKREVTATPLQALVLLNDVQFLEASRVVAEDLIHRYPQDVTSRASESFRKLTSRQASERELKILADLYSEQLAYYRQHPEAASKVISAGERPHAKDCPTPELAATTMMVSALMNHDDFVMKR